MEEEEFKAPKCLACQRELHLGVDAMAVEQGVIGPRGFVILGKKGFFCDEGCIANHFGNGEVEQLTRRVP